MSAQEFLASLTDNDKKSLVQALEEWRKQNERT